MCTASFWVCRMTKPVFDKDKPYGEVFGLPGIRYQQNGNSFNARHEYVSPEEVSESEKPSREQIEADREARKEALKEAFKAELAAGTTVTVVEQKPAPPAPAKDPIVLDEQGLADNVPLEELHWTKLRKLVEDNGGQYRGKDEAIAYLRSLG